MEEITRDCKLEINTNKLRMNKILIADSTRVLKWVSYKYYFPWDIERSSFNIFFIFKKTTIFVFQIEFIYIK